MLGQKMTRWYLAAFGDEVVESAIELTTCVYMFEPGTPSDAVAIDVCSATGDHVPSEAMVNTKLIEVRAVQGSKDGAGFEGGTQDDGGDGDYIYEEHHSVDVTLALHDVTPAKFDRQKQEQFRTDMAANLGVEPSQIEIVSFAAGSIVVTTKINGLEDADHAAEVSATVERKTNDKVNDDLTTI